MQITNNLIEEDIYIEGIKGTIIKDITIKVYYLIKLGAIFMRRMPEEII